MLQWSKQLEVIKGVIEKIIKSPIFSIEQTLYYDDLEESIFITRYPEHVIKPLEYLLSVESDPFYHCST
ncbi:hypothetical protein WQ54_13225 [Bacillus sp. SA1-12]|nr:hypothetical protein WQ54_13225 [Bacillus sp. SA1-12]